MSNQTIEFFDMRVTTEMVLLPEAYSLKPTGRAQWLQRLAWRFLHWRGALACAYTPTTKVTRHTIEAQSFMERIFKQRASIANYLNREGQTLLIGAQDYEELMMCPALYRQFDFRAEFFRGERGRDPQLMGLTVKVIPWMRGMVVMP